ncbi:MAG: aspartate kinase [Clostridia bacterium]|nr:aspartate kinase [Clostridia bacterium]
MGIIIQKFGGSSVADTEKLLKVCEHITKTYEKGNKVVVVVSAQGKTTDKLIEEELEITNTPSKREHDVLVSVGEQITISKLAMCLNNQGYNAISYLGWQLPIITNDTHGNSNIIKINTDKILTQLNKNNIVIVAGFQGITKDGDITTLGRGGSDTTAVALAAYLKADKLYIYTDVDGVYSEDPNTNSKAIKLNEISYNKMINMSKNGAKVLHTKCVELAKKYNVPIHVKSTFKKGTGTIVKQLLS